MKSILLCEAGITGGSVRQAATLLTHLSTQYKTGVFTHANTPNTASEQLFNLPAVNYAYTMWCKIDPIPSGISKIKGFLVPNAYFFKVWFKSIKLWLRHRPDVVCVNNSYRQHAPIVLTAMMFRTPVIAYLRGSGNFTKVERLLSRFVAKFLVFSEEHLDYYANQGVPKERTNILFNGLDESVYQKITAARQQLKSAPAKETPFRIICVGRLIPGKRLDVAIEAMRLITQTHPNTELRILGDGPSKADLEQQIEHHNLKNNVKLLGQIENIADHLVESDIGILCSKSEGMPNVVLEFLAAGLPVITSKLLGISEMVEEGKNGFIVPIGDHETLASKILQLIETPLLKAEFGAHSDKLMSSGKFSKQTQLEKFAAQVEALLS